MRKKTDPFNFCYQLFCPVLFEYLRKDKIVGFTDNYIKVGVQADSSIINTIQNVKLAAYRDECIEGELADVA